MKYDIRPKTIKTILEAHDAYWDEHKRELYQYKSAYDTDFWDKERLNSDSQILVQTSDGYGYIESFIASLFCRNPGVIVKRGLRGKGDPKKAQALANDFLVRFRAQIEDASRLALIYPCAFMKLVPVNSADLYKRVDMMSVNCWDVVLDRDAKRIEDCRFMGHRYFLPLHEAKAKFGNKQYEPIKRQDYFDEYNTFDRDYRDVGYTDEQMFQYIEVVEFYDLVNDRIFFWSPQYSMGEKFLFQEMIPFRDFKGDPCVPIVPLYFNRKPDCPIEGYSSMKRVYDQLYETNLIRTFQANGVRKASRQYIVKRGTFDEESMAQATSGIDGLFIEIDDDDLAGAIRAMPQNPTPPELQVYYDQVQRDKDKGSILAPFTRGESTRSSATEIAALAAYSSSEVGRLARERDATIEYIAKVYLDLIVMYMDEEDITDTVVIDNRVETVQKKDLVESWVIYAQDQASTPLSESVRKREFIQSIPTLQALGVPASSLLNEMVRALGLPESFVEEARQAMQEQAEQQAAMVSAAKARTSGDAIQPDAMEAQQMAQPLGPNNLQSLLGE